jgi:hypothetical protein
MTNAISGIRNPSSLRDLLAVRRLRLPSSSCWAIFNCPYGAETRWPAGPGGLRQHSVRLAFLLALALLCCQTSLAADTAPASGQNANGLPQPLFTRQTAFSIPFKLNPADQADREPIGVELFVSTDRGRSWKFYSKAEPKAAHFVFRAGGDGEFWFQLRTVNRGGQASPSAFDRPGMRIVVDTVPPKLQLDARRGEAGEILLRWQVDEQNLSPESFKILYRGEASETWRPVAVDRQNIRAAGLVWTGQATWWPQSAGGRIEVRGEVADLAGNVAVNHAQVSLAAGGERKLGPSPTAADPPRQNLTARMPTADRRPELNGPTLAPAAPPVAKQFVSPPVRAASGMVGPPPGEQPRMVNSKRFELDYELGPVGPAETVEAELWATRDGGQQWTSFGRATDPHKPFSVVVDEEGLYGFRATVRQANGPASEAPRAGSLPDIWIGVDCTKPNCRIVSADQALGDQAGKLIIRWEADDRLLAVRPVMLSFSPSPGGPWSTIASGLANTGQYVWPIDGRAPQQIYLRLEVRDEAGNLGTAETAEPTRLDPPAPAARIRGVRAAE